MSFEKARAQARVRRRFAQHDNEIPLAKKATAAYAQFERAHHRGPTVPERRWIKEGIAQALVAERRRGEVITPEDVRK
jgi:hypothetical protein